MTALIRRDGILFFFLSLNFSLKLITSSSSVSKIIIEKFTLKYSNTFALIIDAFTASLSGEFLSSNIHILPERSIIIVSNIFISLLSFSSLFLSKILVSPVSSNHISFQVFPSLAQELKWSSSLFIVLNFGGSIFSNSLICVLTSLPSSFSNSL
jgi:hypothetical protein